MLKYEEMKYVKTFDILIHIIVTVGIWMKYGWAEGLFCGSIIVTLDQILSVLRFKYSQEPTNEGRSEG